MPEPKIRKPTHERPAEVKVRGATAGIFDLFEDVEATPELQLEIGASEAISMLRKNGWTLAAAQWAVYDLIQNGSVQPVFRELNIPMLTLENEPPRPPAYMVEDPTKPFDHLTLRLTPRGRRWWSDPKSFVEDVASQADGTEHFSSEERQEIALRLIELREHILQNARVCNDRIRQEIKERFDDLEKQSAVQSKTAWFQLFVSVLATVMATVKPAQDALNDLWRAAGELVMSVGYAIRLLPPPN